MDQALKRAAGYQPRFHGIFVRIAVMMIIGVTMAGGQVRPVNDYGAIGLTQALKRMATTASVMMIGAHPDDEDSALLAYLARGENARTAYLSLTRGDGGQNIIGPELFESLGVLRTEELLQARRLDGAEQYFARAFDYGFSKTLDEARSKWPPDVIMCDVVRGIRAFRPLVVISRFSGTPADGHGHHQYAGWITPQAVKAAADPGQCTDAGEAWRVSKFYIEQGFSATDRAPLQINTGRFDPIYGRSYFEIAIEGRSQHRSQGEGRIELKGDQFSGLFLQTDGPTRPETSPFDGIDTTIEGIARLAESSEAPFNSRLKPLADAVASVARRYRPDAASEIVPDLAAIYKSARDAEWSTRRPESKRFMSDLQRKTADAIRLAAGIQIDLLAESETVVPGDEFDAVLRVYSPSDAAAVAAAKIIVPPRWAVAEQQPPASPQSGPFRRENGKFNAYYKIKVARDERPTQPYWLADTRDGDVYAWPLGSDGTLPFAPAAVNAEIAIKIDETEVQFTRPLEYRYADPSRGEVRREVNVVPALSVSLDRSVLMVPTGAKAEVRSLTMSITNNTNRATTGVAGLNVNAEPEWLVKAMPPTFALKAKGERATITFEITIPAGTKPGKYGVSGNAMVGESIANLTMHTVAYPHIQTHRFYTRAEAEVTILDLRAADRKVGYVMGSGDEVPEAIRQLGMTVTLLEEKDLSVGDLNRFDTIVIGVRATETRPDLMANRSRVLEYVRDGGNLLVQYQRANFAASGLPPYPVTTADTQRTAAGSIARVTDENAAVAILRPSHPFFSIPNKITSADFEGWLQERNAYNLVTFDERYVPLLESHDPGEQPNLGGLVTVDEGKGTWTYCSYSLFRQLPAGVPGAYRLLANLVALPRNAGETRTR